jgi:uncharacterized repeat protein (TIGR01451 family)
LVAAADTVNVGDTICYTVPVTNNGPDAAADVVLTQTVPSNVTLVNADGGSAATADPDASDSPGGHDDRELISARERSGTGKARNALPPLPGGNRLKRIPYRRRDVGVRPGGMARVEPYRCGLASGLRFRFDVQEFRCLC